MILAEELKKDVLVDPYFLDLFKKAERIVARDLFGVRSNESISKDEFSDLMRYADILSHSTDPDARNKAYKIVSLLVKTFGDSESFKLYAGAILAKLGNFPALKFLRDNYHGADALPLERQIEKKVKENIQKTSDGKYTFTDAQYQVRKKLEEFDYFSFSGPTSIGKSFIMKDYIRHLLQSGEPVGGAIVILVPTRALIGQVAIELRREINSDEVNIASHPVLSAYAQRKYKQHVFVFTPERLLAYVSNNTLSIKYLFVDEAQKVIAENDTRSSLYYHAICETTRKFATKIIFASPNIPNPEIFLKLFEKDEVGTLAVSEQTVAQNRYFVDFEAKEIVLLSDLGDEERIDGVQITGSPNELIKNIGKDVNNLIYCNSVAETVRRAKEFAATLPPVPSSAEFLELIGFIAGYVHKDYYLIECLKKGVAFHHGRMPQKVRRKVEDFFVDKDSPLRFVFCTSTLLEGVNLPAKNMFVFNDGHGLQTFEKIDFENLVGRAGRLTKEFSGNVLCVKDDSRRWKDGTELVRKAPLEDVESFLLNKEARKKKEFTNIGKALQNEDFSMPRVGETQNMVHYASIVLLHHIENQGSTLKDRFLQKNKEGLEILKKIEAANKVPTEILRASSTIKPVYQNKVLAHIEKQKEQAVLAVSTESNEVIRYALGTLYDLYGWDKEESSGKDPLIPSGLVKAGFGKSRLNYWGMLLKNWIRSEPLNRLITFSINYYLEKGEIWVYENGRPEKERFINSQRQVNIIIEQIMSDIENGLRFKIQKYFKNYYLLSRHVLGEDRAGRDWSELIEYGTTNSKVIELQNLGFSRGASSYLLNNHPEVFSFDESGNLLDFKELELIEALDKKDEHYDEIIEVIR